MCRKHGTKKKAALASVGVAAFSFLLPALANLRKGSQTGVATEAPPQLIIVWKLTGMLGAK